MDARSVLVTGANRGIGLELVRQLVMLPKPPKYVFATYRNKDSAKELFVLRDTSKRSKVILIQMDITKTDEIVAARKIIEDQAGDIGINLLINNAGVCNKQGFHSITEENMHFHFDTNTVGPIFVLKEMLPLLQKASSSVQSDALGVDKATVLNISSSGGSCFLMDERQPMEFVRAMGYRVSKAALNMAMRIITQEVRDQGILVVNMCPGWVKTDMGSQVAELEVSESVSAILKTCAMLNETHQGAYIDRNGKNIPF